MNQAFLTHSRKKKTTHSIPRDTTNQTFAMAVKENIKTYKKQHLSHDNLTKEQYKPLMELSTREDLIIIQADKGVATVIYGIEEYLKENNNK